MPTSQSIIFIKEYLISNQQIFYEDIIVYRGIFGNKFNFYFIIEMFLIYFTEKFIKIIILKYQ